ncbi:MAG: thioredoxin family protein [Anaerolineae bacterium]|nr:thioredoxin family protein [Anaerolineae bacterium]
MNIGEKAPTFTLPNVDGTTVSLDALLNESKAVAVVFSCNHCPYVRGWEDRMVSIQADYADKGFKMVAVGPNNDRTHPEDSFEEMKKRHKAEGFNFYYVRDESQDVAHAYAAVRTPEVFLLDSDGVLQYHGAIDDNYQEPDAVKHHYLRDALDALLAGKTPPVAKTPPVGCTIKWK